MDKIKSVFGKVSSFIKKKPKEFLALGVFVVALSIYLITNAFAALTPTKSIIITSHKTSYENKEPGSWQVEKSGKWISKGKARVTFDVNTTLMTEDKNTDIILVLDISESMNGDKLTRVKQDSAELVSFLLSNKNNSVSLITFETKSTIVSDFTNDKDELIQQINDLRDIGSTNYYQALVNVDNILKDYEKQDIKDVIVLFLTDGFPNVDTPNQVNEYHYLKKTYPYITINGIQYEMGEAILDPIKEISDNQFHADMETLNNVLFEASTTSSIPYDEFQIVDYIDNNYFKLDSVDDITVSQGDVKLEDEDGKQKITWTMNGLNSGRSVKLTMDINLKEEYVGQGGLYPTNESEEIISKIINIPDEDVKSTKTPVLSDNYKVTYDGNGPDGAFVSNIPSTTNYSVFDTVSLTAEVPTCAGYEFKGWEITNKKVTRVGEDYFIMPEEDVVIRANWSKVEISKSMDGTVNDMGDPIMDGYEWFNEASVDQNDVTSIVTKDNIVIPDTAIEYWDASSYGDGSVVAYIEDDGTGNGTYKVTIGGQGGVILSFGYAMFYNFQNVESIDLTYLDNSRNYNTRSMFHNCYKLTNLNLGNFDTSRVSDMQGMFYGCRSLTDLDISEFNTSKVTNMSWMFSYCYNLENLNLNNLNTSEVRDMSNMFFSCQSLTNIDVSSFDTSNVTTMYCLFLGCSSLLSIDVSNFNTSNVTNMAGMFGGCESITSLDLSNFDTSNVVQMGSDVTHETGLTIIVEGMFYGCTNLKDLNISNFDTSKVETMSFMFYDCPSLTSLDLSSFDTSHVVEMYSMFESCSSLTSLDLSGFDMSKVVYTNRMFTDCENLSTLDFRNADFSSTTSYGSMFYSTYGYINVIVKDSEAESFIRERLNDSYLSNATVTIANPASQTSLLEIGPRKFGPFSFVITFIDSSVM